VARELLDKQFIRLALEKTDRNVSQAARELHVSRNSLMDLIKKYKL
jgi:transcriptional regulator with PAS, ATPase and Fis domain